MFPDVGAPISDHRQQIVMRGMPMAGPRIAHHRISNQRPLGERAGHLSTGYSVPRSNHWQVELRANG
jgi:hypothetical protein